MRLQRARANPKPAVPPGSSAGSSCRTCQTCLFSRFVTLSYPLTRSRVRRGPAAAAQPCPTGLPAVPLPERKGFLPTPQWMLSPLLRGGCTATLLMGILPWQLQEGLGCRRTNHLARTSGQGSGTVCRQQALLASCAPTPFPGLAGIQASFCWYRKCITQLRGSPLPGQRAGKDRGYFQPVFPGWNPTGINFTAGRALI